METGHPVATGRPDAAGASGKRAPRRGPAGAGRAARLGTVLVGGGFFIILALLLTAVTLVKPLDHDEQMYVAAGALLGRGAGLPYRDFPFFQMPDLAFVYAALFRGADHLLLAGRLLNTGAALAGLAVVCALVWRGCPARGDGPRLLAGAGAVLLVVGNGPFTYASGLAWNHDLPVLLTLLALLGVARPGAPGIRRWVLPGGLLGLATGARLAFAPALLPFLLAAARPRPGPAGGGPPPPPGRRPLVPFLAGLTLGLAPTLVLAALAPGRFVFDNATYHLWNAAYWQTLAGGGPERLADKLGYVRDTLLAQPACLALFVLYSLVALPPLARAIIRRQPGEQVPLALAATLVPCLLLGALVPSPTWYQYFYAPVPFMALAVGLGLGAIWGGQGAWRCWGRLAAGAGLGIGAALAVANGAQVYPGYLRDAGFPRPAGWVPLQVHQTGLEIRDRLAAAGTRGAGARVLTLLPLYPLEGGLDIYPELAAASFAWRVAPLIPAGDRRANQVVGPGDLATLVGSDTPGAVLTGGEGALEDALTAYAQTHGYQPASLANGLTLWLKVVQ